MFQKPVETAQRYFEAWNRHDVGAIVATFAETGTYADPVTPGPLTGAAIGAYAQGLWGAFPDLSFDIVSITENASGLVSAEWVMKGTHTGPFNGLPPTGAAVVLPGADFFRVDAGKIHSVQGYFDSVALPRALGLDVIVQPRAIGPFSFGTSVRASHGNPPRPEHSASRGLKPARRKNRKRLERAAGRSRWRCSPCRDLSAGWVRPSATA
jgi:steroid delta-isomerase-like uncharacterized protein